MEKLLIKETFETPGVNLDPETGVLEIKGRSISDDPGIFYQRIFDWMDSYCLLLPDPDQTPSDKKIVVKLHFTYYNTDATKFILDIFKKSDDLYKKCKDMSLGCSVKVEWHYFEDDENSKEEGKDYRNYVSVPVEVIMDK